MGEAVLIKLHDHRYDRRVRNPQLSKLRKNSGTSARTSHRSGYRWPITH